MSDDEYEIPLVDQRYFGAGIKRKRIHFVQSTKPEQNLERLTDPQGISAADRYLSIVLGGQTKRVKTSNDDSAEDLLEKNVESKTTLDAITVNPDHTICNVCGGPIKEGETARQHDLSIVHQLSLKHSHPPSHIDRNTKAFAMLKNHGWEPDSRLGLGAAGEGILHPVKAQENPGRVGLGAVLAEVQAKPKPVKLDAGKVRKLEQQHRRQKDKLREMFYRNEDIDKYLGDK